MSSSRSSKMIHKSSERAAKRRLENQAQDPPGDFEERGRTSDDAGGSAEYRNNSPSLDDSAYSELSVRSATDTITIVSPEKQPTSEREILFEELPPSPKSDSRRQKTIEGKPRKRRGGEGRTNPNSSKDGGNDVDESSQVWHDTLADQVLDYLTPQQDYSDDEQSLPSVESADPPAFLPYFFSHGRAKQDLLDEMQDMMFEKLGCCQPGDWDDLSDMDDDSTAGESTLDGELNKAIIEAKAEERKRKVAEKRAKKIAKRKAKRKAERKAARAKKQEEDAKKSPIAVTVSMDERAHGLEAIACLDYKKCAPDESMIDELVGSDENDSITDKHHVSKKKKRAQTKKSLRASMHYLSSLLLFNRDPRVGGRKLVVRTVDEDNQQKSDQASVDSKGWADPKKLTPITESLNEDTSTQGNTTVSDMHDGRSLETRSTQSRYMGPEPERALYSAPIDAYNNMAREDARFGDSMNKNFNHFRKENFPGMKTDAIITEFNDFLKERGLSRDAKEQVLVKVRKALACQEAELEGVMSFDNLNDVDDDMTDSLSTLRTDPPEVERRRRNDPPENPEDDDDFVDTRAHNDPPGPISDPPCGADSEEVVESAIELLNDPDGNTTLEITMNPVSYESHLKKTVALNDEPPGPTIDPPIDVDEGIHMESAIELMKDGNKTLAITLNVTADETHLENISVPAPEPDLSTVVMANKKRSFRHKLQARISKSSVQKTKVKPAKPTKQVPIVKAERKAPASKEKTPSKTPVKKPLNNLHSSRRSISRKPSMKRLSGLARSLSFFGKSNRHTKDQNLLVATAPRDAAVAVGAYSEDLLSTTSSDDEVTVNETSVEEGTKVNIFEWATSDENQAGSSPAETDPSTQSTTEEYCGPMDPNQSTKAKREAWRRKASSERKEKSESSETQGDEKLKRLYSEPIKMQKASSTKSLTTESKVQRVLSTKSLSTVPKIQKVSSTKSVSTLPRSSGDDVFDDLMTSPVDEFPVDDGWADFSQLSAPQESKSLPPPSSGSPSGVDDFDSLMTPHAVTDDWDDIVSSISVKTEPNLGSSTYESLLHPTTPQRSNIPVVRRRTPSGVEDSFSLSPRTERLPVFVKRHEGPPSHLSPDHVAQFPASPEQLILA